jgi:N-acetyl-gamma-glutamylphosphate reductase
MTVEASTFKATCRCGDVPGLEPLLRRHPGVIVQTEMAPEALLFERHGTRREIAIGIRGEPFGLVELMDNNPLVCAQQVYVPDALSTLVLVALGPLIRADLILERPVIVTDCAGSADELSSALAASGYPGGATLEAVPGDSTCASATAMVAIPTPQDLDDLDALFAEAFGRSFFVRRGETDDDLRTAVQGKPYAAYRLRITVGEIESLLSIDVSADLRGKCGAAQIVHVMNVMAGFEETLGIAG